MPVENTAVAASDGNHSVQFYQRDADLVEVVGRWLKGTGPNDVSILVATQAHRALFAPAAESVAASLHGRVVWLDAEATLEQLIVAGEIDPTAFDVVIGGVVREAAQSGGSVRVYGEMVALLWDAGNVLGAIELEALWNDLVRDTPFALLCSYPDPAGSHLDPVRADALARVCEAHSACHHTWSDDATGFIDASAARGAQAELPSKPSAPGYARRLSAQALRQWGYSPAATQDAGLVVSELVTNAVLHAKSRVTLTIQRDESKLLRIAVRDSTPLAPLAPTSPFPAHPTHGLGVVAALCDAWGVKPVLDGKIVWAQIPA